MFFTHVNTEWEAVFLQTSQLVLIGKQDTACPASSIDDFLSRATVLLPFT
jgi:hypothetical protein